jgi:hypothetical protein
MLCLGFKSVDVKAETIDEPILGDTISYSSFNNKLIVFDLKKFSDTLSSSNEKYDYMKVAFTIQGLINRKQPLLYYKYESNGFTFNGKEMDQAWLDELKNDSNGFKNYTIVTYNSFYDIINLAKNLGVINGIVLWDNEVPATGNVASTIAGVENLIPIRYDVSKQSCYTDLVVNRKISTVKRNLVNKFKNIRYLPDANLNPMNSGTTSSGSSKNDAYLWAKKYYLDTKKTNSTLMGYSRDSWLPSCNAGACFVETDLPRSLRPNEEREVSVTVLNYNITSGERWTKEGLYRIGALSSNDFKVTWSEFGFEQGDNPKGARLYFDSANPIDAGERVTIRFKIKAPSSNGSYYLNLGIVHDGVAWFSGDLTYNINVSSISSNNRKEEHFGTYNTGIFNTALNTGDYLIKNKAFFFDLSPDNRIAPIDDRNQPVGTDVNTLKSILNQQSINNNKGIFTVVGFVPWFIKYTSTSDKESKMGDVESEWRMVEYISSYGGETDADAANPVGLTNASIFSQVKMSNYKQNNDKDAVKSGKVVKEIYDPNTIYFSVYMGDYDGGSWTSGVLPSMYSYPTGLTDKYPLIWPIDSDLSKRIPQLYNWLYKTQRANDYFAAGNNGSGYLNPTVTNILSTWRAHNVEMNKKFDIDITGFLIGGYNKIRQNVQNEFAKMSPILVGYQIGAGVDTRKVGSTPFIPVIDAGGDTASILGENIYKSLVGNRESFNIVRVGRVDRKMIYSGIDYALSTAIQKGKKIKIVDPYTLAYLYNNHPTQYKGCYTNGTSYKWINSNTIPSGYKYVSSISSQNNCGLIGDVNGDGKVSASDYGVVKKHILGTKLLTGDSLKRADVNGDGKITSLDYIMIRKIILNK